MDQTWSNLMKLLKLGGGGLSPTPTLFFDLLNIFDYWKTWLKLVMLENLQACFRCLFDLSFFTNADVVAIKNETSKEFFFSTQDWSSYSCLVCWKWFGSNHRLHSDLKCPTTFGNWIWDVIVGNWSIMLNFYHKGQFLL